MLKSNFNIIFAKETINIDNIQTPNNLSECFDAIEFELRNSPEKEWFKNSTEDEIINSTHYALGEWIRNNWKLWSETSHPLKEYFAKINIHHHDDMSSIILTSFWRHLHNQPLEVEKQTQVYIDHWEKIKCEQLSK